MKKWNKIKLIFYSFKFYDLWLKDSLTKRLHFYFPLSCIVEGNGNPLQCSCLGNPRDGWAWWAAVYGVTQSRTWLKLLNSSNICSTKMSNIGNWRSIFSGSKLKNLNVINTKYLFIIFLEIDKRELGALANKE